MDASQVNEVVDKLAEILVQRPYGSALRIRVNGVGYCIPIRLDTQETV